MSGIDFANLLLDELIRDYGRWPQYGSPDLELPTVMFCWLYSWCSSHNTVGVSYGQCRMALESAYLAEQARRIDSLNFGQRFQLDIWKVLDD